MLLAKNLACITVMLVSSGLSWLFSIVLFGIKTNSFIFLALIFLANAIFLSGFDDLPLQFCKNRARRRGGKLDGHALLAWFSGIMFRLPSFLRGWQP